MKNSHLSIYSSLWHTCVCVKNIIFKMSLTHFIPCIIVLQTKITMLNWRVNKIKGLSLYLLITVVAMIWNNFSQHDEYDCSSFLAQYSDSMGMAKSGLQSGPDSHTQRGEGGWKWLCKLELPCWWTGCRNVHPWGQPARQESWLQSGPPRLCQHYRPSFSPTAGETDQHNRNTTIQ